MVSNHTNEYRTIFTTELVLIKVPQQLDYIPPHVFHCGDKTIEMDEHYKSRLFFPHRISSEKPVILNQKYFGIDSENAGKLIVAKVTVEEKIVRDDRKYIQIIIERQKQGLRARKKMWIKKYQAHGIPITNTEYFIKFENS